MSSSADQHLRAWTGLRVEIDAATLTSVVIPVEGLWRMQSSPRS